MNNSEHIYPAPRNQDSTPTRDKNSSKSFLNFLNSDEARGGVYNQALELLKKGRSKEQVLLQFEGHRAELAPLLELSGSLLAMPKNIVPTPLMRRKYAIAPTKKIWLAWLHISRLASVSMALVLVFSSLAAAGYQTANSAPGNTFFPLKKSVEKLQLIFTPGQTAKATLQVQIAQNRLEQAQVILANSSSNQEQKSAALNELSSQTTSAIAEVGSAAKNDPKQSSNRQLLNSLDNITTQQKTLLTNIKPDSDIKLAANNARESLNQNTSKLSEIKHSVASANADQALADLSAKTNSVVVLGDISQILKNQITVEKTVFSFSPQTSIKDSDGNFLSLSNLTEGVKVNVVGVKNQNILMAQQIMVIIPEVSSSGSQSSTTADSAINPSTTATSIIKKPVDSSSSSTTGDSTAANPNAAIGTVIFEDPGPQFGQ